MEWREIKRDKDGFVADESVSEMYAMLPIAVLNQRANIIKLISIDNWDGAILTPLYNTGVTHYCTLPQLPEDNVDIF